MRRRKRKKDLVDDMMEIIPATILTGGVGAIGAGVPYVGYIQTGMATGILSKSFSSYKKINKRKKKIKNERKKKKKKEI